eukprot:15989754-Heterocapsa_arctica.AAC.1
MRRIWLPSTGASTCTGLSAFLSLTSVRPRVCLVKSLCRSRPPESAGALGRWPCACASQVNGSHSTGATFRAEPLNPA